MRITFICHVFSLFLSLSSSYFPLSLPSLLILFIVLSHSSFSSRFIFYFFHCLFSCFEFRLFTHCCHFTVLIFILDSFILSFDSFDTQIFLIINKLMNSIQFFFINSLLISIENIFHIIRLSNDFEVFTS